jgi:hypothetical protein
MPRFYTLISVTAISSPKDEVGLDLAGIEEAKVAAVTSGRELVANNVKFDTDKPHTEIIVTDENGTQLATISAKDLLTETLKGEVCKSLTSLEPGQERGVF